MDVMQVLAAHGVSVGKGKSKLKLWELPIQKTETVNYNYYDTSTHNFWFAFNNVKLWQPYNNTSLNIYLRNKFIVSVGVGAMYYRKGQVLIDDNGDIYILSDANLKIYTLKASERYATLYDSPVTNIQNNRIGNVNFKYGNYIFFTATNGSDINLLKFDISSGKAVLVSQIMTGMGTGNYNFPLFVSGKFAYYSLPNQWLVKKVDLDTMTIATINLTNMAGYNPSGYIGYYNGKHFFGCNHSTTRNYIVVEYPDTGGAATNAYGIEYDTKIANDLGVTTQTWFSTGYYELIQASDKVVALTVGMGTLYNDSLIFFDMSKQKAIRAEANFSRGGYINLIGTAGKVMVTKMDNYAEVMQFEIDPRVA